MDDKRVEAVAWLIGCVLNYECGGDWNKLNEFAKKHYTRVAKSALELADAAAWQPIESAPHGVVLQLAWKDKSGKWKYAFDKASWDWKLGDYRDGVSYHGRATHWQPLPAPPSDATEGER